MGESNWRRSGSTRETYNEKRFPNEKIGHVDFFYGVWKSFYDGVYLGSANNRTDAQILVEQHYLAGSKYGRVSQ